MFNVWGKFEENELEQTLREAYREDSKRWLLIDSRRQRYQMACVNYGLEQGLLKEERPIEQEQYTAYRFSFTEKAKERFA